MFFKSRCSFFKIHIFITVTIIYLSSRVIRHGSSNVLTSVRIEIENLTLGDRRWRVIVAAQPCRIARRERAKTPRRSRHDASLRYRSRNPVGLAGRNIWSGDNSWDLGNRPRGLTLPNEWVSACCGIVCVRAYVESAHPPSPTPSPCLANRLQ